MNELVVCVGCPVLLFLIVSRTQGVVPIAKGTEKKGDS